MGMTCRTLLLSIWRTSSNTPDALGTHRRRPTLRAPTRGCVLGLGAGRYREKCGRRSEHCFGTAARPEHVLKSHSIFVLKTNLPFRGCLRSIAEAVRCRHSLGRNICTVHIKCVGRADQFLIFQNVGLAPTSTGILRDSASSVSSTVREGSSRCRSSSSKSITVPRAVDVISIASLSSCSLQPPNMMLLSGRKSEAFRSDGAAGLGAPTSEIIHSPELRPKFLKFLKFSPSLKSFN